MGLLTSGVFGMQTVCESVISPVKYTMADLLELRSAFVGLTPKIPLDLPKNMKVRKRGKKGGMRYRNKKNEELSHTYHQQLLAMCNL